MKQLTPVPATRVFVALSRVLTIGAVALLTACADGGNATAPEQPAAFAKGGASSKGTCAADSKLIGLIALSTADSPTTWWGITKAGLTAAGVTDYQAEIEKAFGTTFGSEAEAIQHLVDQIVPFDVNGNGYVCAYEVRGTHAGTGDPNFGLYHFITRDDK